MPSSPFKTACIQTRPQPDFQSAIDELRPLIKRACERDADLVALPEYCGGLVSDGPYIRPPSAREEKHPVLDWLRKEARDKNIWLLVGSVAIDGPDGRIINRSCMLSQTGAIRARYDKIHMFDIQLPDGETYRESGTVCPGSEAVASRTHCGTIGMTICYDLRFPSLYRNLAQAGAEVLAVPSAFTKTTGEAHWHILNRARAIENGAFVISPCAVGKVPGGGECFGHSLIVDPWGRILADAGGSEPGVIYAELDMNEVREARRRIPSLSHDRPFKALQRLRAA